MAGQLANIDGRIHYRRNTSEHWTPVAAAGLTMLLADNGILPHDELTSDLFLACSKFNSAVEDDFAARMLTALFVLNPQKRRPILNGTPLEWVKP